MGFSVLKCILLQPALIVSRRPLRRISGQPVVRDFLGTVFCQHSEGIQGEGWGLVIRDGYKSVMIWLGEKKYGYDMIQYMVMCYGHLNQLQTGIYEAHYLLMKPSIH